MKARLSVDIGGTFTDVVLAHESQLRTTKVLTTYEDPAKGVMAGIENVLSQSDIQAQDIGLVLHGTTLATNALIERRGAPTALLTTFGHRDALEMAFENRFEQYDVNIDRPAPLVPRFWRIGVHERVAFDGDVLKQLDEADLMRNVDRLVEEGVTAIAVGYLHSYINPHHEQTTAQLINTRHPQVSVSLSSAVCPEIREYERLSTTVANAYVKPLMSRYLASLDVQLRKRGILGQVLMMTSGGGLTTLQAAAEYPIRLVESGPAGGAMLAADLAATHKLDRVLSFDMGGTTAKICLIDDAKPQHSRAFEVDRSYRFKKGSGLPVRIPVVEMVEIGARGGSLISVDALQRIQVGPESAGSEPGPACYGGGGEAATVTDADVVLGKLSPETFAGGKLQLNVQQAQQAVTRDIAQPLALDVVSAAYAAAEIVEENMASAARAHANEWGKEVQGRCLIAFGGAAPLHAAQLARKLKIDSVVIPSGAGVGSAIGFLRAPIRFEVVRSSFMRLDVLDTTVLAELFDAMYAEAAQVLKGAGVDTDGQVGIAQQREAYMRYVGQGYEIAVDISDLELSQAPSEQEGVLRQRFEQAYQALYGRVIPGMAIEILSFTLSLSASAGNVPLQSQSESEVGSSEADAQLFDGITTHTVPVKQRAQLKAQQSYSGPMLIVEAQTTTVVPADATVQVLADGALHITLGQTLL